MTAQTLPNYHLTTLVTSSNQIIDFFVQGFDIFVSFLADKLEHWQKRL